MSCPVAEVVHPEIYLDRVGGAPHFDRCAHVAAGERNHGRSPSLFSSYRRFDSCSPEFADVIFYSRFDKKIPIPKKRSDQRFY